MYITDDKGCILTAESNIDHRGIFTLCFDLCEKERLLHIGDALSEVIEPYRDYFHLYHANQYSFLFDFVGKTTICLDGETDLILNVINSKIPFETFEHIIMTLEKQVEGITFSPFGYNEYSTNKGNGLLYDINKYKKIQKFIQDSESALKKIIRNPKYKFVKNYIAQSDAKKIDKQSIVALSKKSYQATSASEYPKIQFYVNQQQYSVPEILNIVNEFSFATHENLCILSLLYAYLNFLNCFKEKLEIEKNKENKYYSNEDSFFMKQNNMRKKRQEALIKDVDDIRIKILQYYHLLSVKIGYNNRKPLLPIIQYFTQSQNIFHSLPPYRLFTTHIKSWLDSQQNLQKDSKNFVSLQNVNKIYEMYVLLSVFESVTQVIHSKQKNGFQFLWEKGFLGLNGDDIDCDIVYDKSVNEALPNFIDRLGSGQIRPDVILKFKHHSNNKEFILIIDAKFTDNPYREAKNLTWKYLYRLFAKQESSSTITGLIIASPLLMPNKKLMNDDFYKWASKDNIVEYASKENSLCFGNQNINFPYIQIIKSTPSSTYAFKEQIQNLVSWIIQLNQQKIMNDTPEEEMMYNVSRLKKIASRYNHS